MKINFLYRKSQLKQTFYAVFDASLVTTPLNEGPLSVTEMMEAFARTECNFKSLTENEKSVTLPDSRKCDLEQQRISSKQIKFCPVDH